MDMFIFSKVITGAENGYLLYACNTLVNTAQERQTSCV